MYQKLKCNVLHCSIFIFDENWNATCFEATSLVHSDLRLRASFSNAMKELNKTTKNVFRQTLLI
jgi:hypothetical protein